MKKVLIISSSPRFNGNSEILCHAFANGAIKSGNQVKEILLREKKIKYCLGCSKCYEDGNCVFDDMTEIKQALLEADVIVLGTPVYFHNMSAQLKTMIDRTVGFYEKLQNKEFYYILTATSTETEDELNFVRTIDSIRGWTLDCLEGSSEKGIIKAGGLSKVGDAKNSKYEIQAYTLGENV